MNQAYAGIDLGGTNIKYGLCSASGEVIIFRTIPAAAREGPEHLLARLLGCSAELVQYASENRLEVSHIGIGTPGVVDIATGEIVGMSPNIPGWKGANPKMHLESDLGLPVFVDNDVNVMALAESVFGAARGCSNVLAATVGTGIGGGILVDGKLYRGTVGGAGEFGHMTIVMDGKSCNCGRQGCLERYAAAPHLIEMAEELAGDSGSDSPLTPILKKAGRLTVKDIFDAFLKQADKIAGQAIELSADYLACGLASVAAVLDPQVVVIGGGVADAGGKRYICLVEQLLRKRAIESSAERIRAVKAQLGNRAGFIGAGILGDHI
jgi:glucokinase